MSTFLRQLIPAAILLFGLLTMLIIAWGWRWWVARDRRRAPFTEDLLREPGHTLRKELDGLEWELSAQLMLVALLPLVVYVVYLQGLASEGVRRSGSAAVILLLATLTFFAVVVWPLVRLLNRRRDVLLGWNAERAVGQRLDQLVAHGFRVYHDLSADGFNIDHVVVGRGGVFAVETKGRRKPPRGRGNRDAAVNFDGHRLLFPGWADKRSPAQARDNARWLGRWLTEATGTEVHAFPRLTLPGWMVNNTTPPKDFLAINPRQRHLERVFVREGVTLSDELIQRIAYQLDQRCRDVTIQERPSLRDRLRSRNPRL